jgi:hypothetical protein
MLLYLHEDRPYLHGVAHHRDGFVLDCGRPPHVGHGTLHRAVCPVIKQSKTKKTHWTTGRHMKACSLNREELEAWAAEQTKASLTICPDCLVEQPPADEEPIHLTKTDREVLSFVLEVSALHLDDADSYYALNVGTAARCLGKTPGQLGASLRRLVADGLITLVGEPAADKAVPASCPLLPTAAALRTLPIYESAADEDVDAELAKLVDQLEG